MSQRFVYGDSHWLDNQGNIYIPEEPVITSGNYTLQYSTVSYGSYWSPLNNATITGDIYVNLLVTSTGGRTISRVDWYVRGFLHRNDDTSAPYNLQPGETAFSHSSWGLDGTYELRAEVLYADATFQTVSAYVTINGLGDGTGGSGDGETSGAFIAHSLTAANTGPAYFGVTSFTDSGSIFTTSAGQLIENMNISGVIRVSHNDVTIRACKVQAPATTGNVIIVDAGVSGLLIEGCEVFQDLTLGGTGNGIGGQYEVAVGLPRNVVRRCNIHHTADGYKGSGGWTFEANWVHPEVKYADSHSDGIQVRKITTQDLIIRDCKYVMGSNFGNACIYITDTAADVSSDAYIERCFLQGSSASSGIFLYQKDGRWTGTAYSTDNHIVQGWNGGPHFPFRINNAAGTTPFTHIKSGNRLVDVNNNDIGEA